MVNEYRYSMGGRKSVIRRLFEYGSEKAKVIGRENIYDYSLGNPSIPAPPAVNEALIDILQNDRNPALHGYSNTVGFDDTRKAIADDLTARMGMTIHPGELIMTTGVAPGLSAVIGALNIDENTEIAVIAPFFPEYRIISEGTGNKLTVVDADTEHLQINLDDFRRKINEHTQAVILNSPNNPTGAVLKEEVLRAAAEILEEKSAEYDHPIYILADEPYRELVYDGIQVPWIPSIYRDTIVLYSYSKSLSLAGERVGYILIPEQVTDADKLMTAVKGQLRIIGHSCAPVLMQKMLARCAGVRPDMRVYDENRTLLYNTLTEIGYDCIHPDGTFYLFVRSPMKDALAFSDLCKEKNLLIVPSDDFGVPGFLRISYCVPKAMIERSLPAFREAFEEALSR